uniref:C3H1-type domain-containing protein n=1 Tax=Meloidogyne enterolobii TaxID=390850 RepID=A0A6V7UMU9_MELEN|nr:unnamed protein product [Meloidogyne enterolobii]
MAPPRPTTPRSEDGEGKPPRAFVRQCVFYEKYGGCKFGKDCFYAHNDEMTLGLGTQCKWHRLWDVEVLEVE